MIRIGDSVKLRRAVKAHLGEGYIVLPKNTIGTLEERDDDDMFHFVATVQGKRAVSYVARREITKV